MTMLERAGLPIRVTTPERTFVDVLMHPELAGGWEEAWRSLSRMESLDLDEVVRYVSLLDHPTTSSKVGFFLESHQRELGVSNSQLDELRRSRPLHPCNAKGGPEYRLVAVPGWKMSLPYPAVFGEWEDRPKTPRRRRARAGSVS
jgi:predicted transcriptional regulator of viral defense system